MPPRRAPRNGNADDEGQRMPNWVPGFFQNILSVGDVDPVQEARRAGAVEFMGYQEPTDNEAWLVQLDRICSRLRFTSEQKTEAAVGLLSGDAYFWWTYTGRVVADTPWVVFQQLFMERYFNDAARMEKYEEFTNLRQGDMSVSEYRDVFTRLSRFAPEMVATEEARCRRFELGLRLDILAMLTAMPRTNFNEFVSAATRSENLARNIQRTVAHGSGEGEPGRGSSRRRRCDTSGSRSSQAEQPSDSSMGSHQQSSRRDWRRTRGRRQGSNTSSSESSQSARQYHSPIPREYPLCEFCNKHHVGQCRHGTEVCYHCGQAGHYVRFCPQYRHD